MKINLREDEESQYISLYTGFLNEVQSLNKKVNDVLNEVMLKSKYDKLQRLISRIIDAYTETILNNVETGVFPTWQESGGSLRACLRSHKAGKDADEVCAQIEQKMEDLMHDILKIEKADAVITERPIVNEEGLERIEDICRQARTEMDNIKEEYISQALEKETDNEIYGTLKPLIVGVAANMDAFFETSLNSFGELHEFVQEISTKLHDIPEENGIHRGGMDKKVESGLAKAASSMGNADKAKSLSDFKKVTELLYKTIRADEGNEHKKLPYELIAQIMPIYHKFYSDFGSILKDKFTSQDEREEFVRREYFAVIRERGNEQFFEGGEIWTFRSHAYHTYVVFNRVADMEKNIAECCIKGTANDENLLYGAYVLFTPILEGYIAEEDGSKYKKFSTWASDEILRILGADKNEGSSDKDEYIDTGDDLIEEDPEFDVDTIDWDAIGIKEDKICFDEELYKQVSDIFRDFEKKSNELQHQFVSPRYKENIRQAVEEYSSLMNREIFILTHLDYKQFIEGNLTEREKELGSYITNLFKDFCNVEGISADEKHRYAKFIRKIACDFGIGEIVHETVEDFGSMWESVVRTQVDYIQESRDALYAKGYTVYKYIVPLFNYFVKSICNFYYSVMNFAKSDGIRLSSEESFDQLGAFGNFHMPEDFQKKNLDKGFYRCEGEDAELGKHFIDSRGKITGELKANMSYYYKVLGINNRETYYNYSTDSSGRIWHAYTDCLVLGKKKERDPEAQSTVGKGKGRKEVDDGGHIFGTQFGGSKYADNILAQHMAINEKASRPIRKEKNPDSLRAGYKGGQWFRLETLWVKLLKDEKVSNVAVDILINYGESPQNKRPESYQVITAIQLIDGTVNYKFLMIKNKRVIALSKDRKFI